jgi:23S rRNA U2552 (ribose-2'-O)-methylase RlmE/FtsJ
VPTLLPSCNVRWGTIRTADHNVNRHTPVSVLQILQGDAQDLSREALNVYTQGRGFDTVLSDMMGDTMGAGSADVAQSLELCECAAKIALGQGFCMTEEEMGALPGAQAEEFRAWDCGVLRTHGCLVMKIFEGALLTGPRALDLDFAQNVCMCARHVHLQWCLPCRPWLACLAAVKVTVARVLRSVHNKVTLILTCMHAGEGTKGFAGMLKPSFDKVRFVRPKATRKESREVYIVCTGRRVAA